MPGGHIAARRGNCLVPTISEATAPVIVYVVAVGLAVNNELANVVDLALDIFARVIPIPNNYAVSACVIVDDPDFFGVDHFVFSRLRGCYLLCP